MGSTVLETNTSGNQTADQKYRAYGKQRDTGAVVTDHKFTGQKLDGTGLQYYNARYYDPAIGVFVSPDTIVPDATNVFDYNRYMYASGNPLKFSDPTGHCNVAGGLSGRMISADSCGGGGAGAAARAALQLGVDAVGVVILANAAVQAERSNQESVPLPQPTVEVSGVPLQDQTPQTGWLTSFDAPPQSQVLADPLPAEQNISEIIYTSITQDIQQRGKQVSGLFPRTSSSSDILFRADSSGAVTHYQVYDLDGNPVKRVDLVGKPHGGVPTPHVLEYEQNTAHDGTVFYKPSKQARPARPDEIP